MLIQKIAGQPTDSVSAPPDDRPQRQADPDRSAPHADRLRALARVGEDVADDRHGDRIEHRSAHCLQHAKGDQQTEVRCDAAQQRSEREENQAQREHTLAAQTVAHRARQHQQARQHERIGVDRPLQARHRRVQLTPDRRQRDVDDRVVQPDDQQAHAADREDQPPARARDGRAIGDQATPPRDRPRFSRRRGRGDPGTDRRSSSVPRTARPPRARSPRRRRPAGRAR